MKEIKITEEIQEGWKVDKIKFKYLVRDKRQIQRLIDNLSTETRTSQIWESKNVKQCRYNYTIETEQKGIIYIGIESNQPNIAEDEKRKTIVLEYNPNKVDPFKINYLKFLKEIELHRRKIMFIDLAYDIEININDLEYTKRRINERYCHIGTKSLETIYLGRKGENGAVKIYDKVKEMNKNIDEEIEDTGELIKRKYIGELTRYEISIKPEELATAFNIVNPFILDKLMKLHQLNIKEEDQIPKEIEKLKVKDKRNITLLHLGYIELIEKNNRKAYKEMYNDIKKSCTLSKYNEKLKNFTNTEALKTLKNYLNVTTTHKENQLLIENLD